MENFFELIMKNGSSLIVSTNDEGVCEFSMNGELFFIQTQRGPKGEISTFSFSVEKSVLAGEEEFSGEAGPNFSVISVRKANQKRLRELGQKRKMFGRIGEAEMDKSREPFLQVGNSSFRAYRGGVNTPYGWSIA